MFSAVQVAGTMNTAIENVKKLPEVLGGRGELLGRTCQGSGKGPEMPGRSEKSKVRVQKSMLLSCLRQGNGG